jgi:hypothetical protein
VRNEIWGMRGGDDDYKGERKEIDFFCFLIKKHYYYLIVLIKKM